MKYCIIASSLSEIPERGSIYKSVCICDCVVIVAWYTDYFIILVHYADVIMTKMASQITSLTIVYSTVYSDADQIKHQSSASLAFVWGIHRDRWIPRTKGQLRGKCFHLMTSSWDDNVLSHVLCFNGSWWFNRNQTKHNNPVCMFCGLYCSSQNIFDNGHVHVYSVNRNAPSGQLDIQLEEAKIMVNHFCYLLDRWHIVQP